MSIFVSVAAFCDPWLLQTVGDACAKASQPAQLVFGVFEQDAEPRQAELQAVVDACGATLRYRQVHPAASRGVCWARAQVGQLYGGEDHLLQIDSHMLFEPGWDAKLLAQHHELLQRSAKPLISCYPWAFEIEDELPVVKVQPSSNTTLVMRPVPDAQLHPDNPTMIFRTEHIFARQPLPGCHVAGGFLFAAGAFVHEVPYDPELYFHGEEQSLALRAWTRGWDIWHVPEMPVYHLYKQPNTAHRAHHWHPEWEALREFSQQELTARAAERLADLLYERRDLGIHGLGTERGLDEYARRFGIDYRARSIDHDFQRIYAAYLPPPRKRWLQLDGVAGVPGFDADGWQAVPARSAGAALPNVESGSVDAVVSRHGLQRLYAHQAATLLAEWLRVLRDDGYAVITCPDLQQVCALVAQGHLADAAYTSAAGPITPLDLIYGYGPALASGDAGAAHRSGFSEQSLLAALREAGFATVASLRRSANLEIWALASKSPRDEHAMRALAAAHLPGAEAR
jgi:SAM-dependent methyltransferase